MLCYPAPDQEMLKENWTMATNRSIIYILTVILVYIICLVGIIIYETYKVGSSIYCLHYWNYAATIVRCMEVSAGQKSRMFCLAETIKPMKIKKC